MAIQFLRTSESTKSSSTKVLPAGQPLYTTDEPSLAIGDGSTEAKSLPSLTNLYAHRIELAKTLYGAVIFGYSRDPKYTLATSSYNAVANQWNSSGVPKAGSFFSAPFIKTENTTPPRYFVGYGYVYKRYSQIVYPIIDVACGEDRSNQSFYIDIKYISSETIQTLSFEVSYSDDPRDTETWSWVTDFTDDATLCSPSILA